MRTTGLTPRSVHGAALLSTRTWTGRRPEQHQQPLQIGAPRVRTQRGRSHSGSARRAAAGDRQRPPVPWLLRSPAPSPEGPAPLPHGLATLPAPPSGDSRGRLLRWESRRGRWARPLRSRSRPAAASARPAPPLRRRPPETPEPCARRSRCPASAATTPAELPGAGGGGDAASAFSSPFRPGSIRSAARPHSPRRRQPKRTLRLRGARLPARPLLLRHEGSATATLWPITAFFRLERQVDWRMRTGKAPRLGRGE